MTTIEDVLLSLNGIRYKKGVGTLYIMKERIAWIAENRDTVTVSHHFSDIKTQKISSEGRPKVQLQVVLHDGNSSTFHFDDGRGIEEQIAARDQVKEYLHKLLPNFKRVVDEELQEKSRLLKSHPKLLQLYRELVISQVITSNEFWERHAEPYLKAEKEQNEEKQEKGVPAGFLADIKPQTDGCNGLKYNLNADIIECIFKTYPAVKRKHTENVPVKMTEEEFWVKFFQSHYFHRDRLTAGTKDMFSECGKVDDQLMKTDVMQNSGDLFLDIKGFIDLPLEEGYGGTPDESSPQGGNLVHQSMIKRFNQHSIMVLKTVGDYKDKQNTANGPMNANPTGAGETMEVANKKQRLIEKIILDDLASSDTSTSNNELNLQTASKERILIPPSLSNHSSAHNNELHMIARRMDEVQMLLAKSTENLIRREPIKKTLNATAAVNALGELSPGGALMRNFQNDSTLHINSPTLENDLQNLYSAAYDLLRHLYRNLSIETHEDDETVHEVYQAIERFKEIRLVPFEKRAMHELSSLDSPLTEHLRLILNNGVTAYMERHEKVHKQR